jgi:Flp pilus assembly protein TadD
MGNKDEAVAALEKAAAIQPKSALAHAQLGLAYFNSGRRAEARREIEEARTLDPKDTTVQMAVIKLTTGQ